MDRGKVAFTALGLAALGGVGWWWWTERDEVTRLASQLGSAQKMHAAQLKQAAQSAAQLQHQIASETSAYQTKQQAYAKLYSAYQAQVQTVQLEQASLAKKIGALQSELSNAQSALTSIRG